NVRAGFATDYGPRTTDESQRRPDRPRRSIRWAWRGSLSGPFLAAAPQPLARTFATSVARTRGGGPAPPGRGRRPGRGGREGFRAPAGRRPPGGGGRSTLAAPAPPLRRGATPRPAAATGRGRPRRPGGSPPRPPGWHDRATTPAPPGPAARRPR